MASDAFLFLERRFGRDREHIENMIDYYASSGFAYQV